MARSWVIEIPGGIGTSQPDTSYAGKARLPTTNIPCDMFSGSADESVLIEFVVPWEHTGQGLLRLDLFYCANDSTGTNTADVSIYTEFKSINGTQPLNTDNFDTSADNASLQLGTVAYNLNEKTITLTPSNNPSPGDFGRLRITRLGSTDTLNVDLYVVRYVIYEEV